jgi:hypothetical protein
MYVSSTFHTTPGKTHEVEQVLLKFANIPKVSGALQPADCMFRLLKPGASNDLFLNTIGRSSMVRHTRHGNAHRTVGVRVHGGSDATGAPLSPPPAARCNRSRSDGTPCWT